MNLVLKIWLGALTGFNFGNFIAYHRWLSAFSGCVTLAALIFIFWLDHKYGG